MKSPHLTEIGTDEFEEKLAAEELAVVIFYSEMCGSCKDMPNILAGCLTVPGTVEHKFKYFMMNTDVCHKQAEELGVKGLPTSIAFTKGKVLGEMVGAPTLSSYYSQWLADMRNKTFTQ